jgi:hypothetical protein
VDKNSIDDKYIKNIGKMTVRENVKGELVLRIGSKGNLMFLAIELKNISEFIDCLKSKSKSTVSSKAKSDYCVEFIKEEEDFNGNFLFCNSKSSDDYIVLKVYPEKDNLANLRKFLIHNKCKNKLIENLTKFLYSNRKLLMADDLTSN